MGKYSGRVLICIVVAFLCCIPFLFQPSTGLAQFDSPLPEPNPIVTSYSNDVGISYEEAERRLILQNEMNSLERKIIDGEPTYAGSWMEHEPDFGLVIAFASPDGEKLIQKYIDGVEWGNLIRVQQSSYTASELDDISAKVVEAARETEITFAGGSNYQTSKVELYTSQPEELHSQLEKKDSIQPYLKDIAFIYQESTTIPAAFLYPYLPGGHPITTCTSGYTLMRNSDNRRFMSTSGHCGDSQDVVYNGTPSVYLGTVIFQNDPQHNLGNNYASYGDDIDLQVHDVTARSFDLTNAIRNGATSTVKVTTTETKAGTMGSYVCKYGKVSSQTCGLVANVNYAPGGVYGTSDNYVLVNRYPGSTGDLACPGDSGSPVYEYIVGGLSGIGILSGREDTPCSGSAVDWFIYTPVDEITRAGFSILTTHYQQRYHQNVWWTETSCNEYVQAFDDDGNSTGANTPYGCNTIAAPGGASDIIQTYTGYVMGNHWREGMWRNNSGYTRNVPLNNNGTINWGAAPAWAYCCGGTGPRSQDAYIVGNTFYQNVYWTETNCREYQRALDNNGNPTGTQTDIACRTTLPSGSSGTINSYTAYVVGGVLREGIWRNGVGYARNVPLNATNTDINWGSAPTWSCCLSGTIPRAQGGYVLSYP